MPKRLDAHRAPGQRLMVPYLLLEGVSEASPLRTPSKPAAADARPVASAAVHYQDDDGPSMSTPADCLQPGTAILTARRRAFTTLAQFSTLVKQALDVDVGGSCQ